MLARSLRSFGLGMLLCALTTSVASAQRQIQKLLPSQPQTASEYAYACGISGDWAITGAPYSDFFGNSVGAAYVSQRINGTWVEIQTLFPTGGQGYDTFGQTVAMDGDLAVIGAPGFRIAANNRVGAVFVFERVGSTWVERQRLMRAVPSGDVQFGTWVDISGDRIAVHAGTSGVGYRGEVSVFERVGAMWTEVALLQPANLSYSAAFGRSLDIDADTLVAGSQDGLVFVFARASQGVWSLQQQIPTPNHVTGGLNNGVIVALSGDSLFLSVDATVGAAVHAGRAHAFERSLGVWTETQTLVPSDVQSDDQFIMRLVDGDVAIGHSFADDDAGINSGSHYVFRRSNGVWSQTFKVLTNDLQNSQFPAWDPAFADDVLMIGAPGDTEACASIPTSPFCRTGAVYFFDVPATARQFGSCSTATPCGNPDGHGGCRNSTGQGAILQASGTGSVLRDDLILEVRHLPPSAPALFFMGDAESFQILGAGQLRVAGGTLGLFRLGLDFADGQGVIVRAPGLVASTQSLGLGAITAGQSWNIQAWYRDSASTCAPSNLSNAYQVAFGP